MNNRRFYLLISVLAVIFVFPLWLGNAWPITAQFQTEPTPNSISQSNPSPLRATSSSSNILFSYQGQLLDADGEPVNGQVAMVFSLYNQQTGGAALWTESYTGLQAVPVTDGLFHVLLGSMTPISVTKVFSGDLYLELSVAGETMTPRELLTSVAYAVEATTLPDGAVTRGSLAISGTLDMYSNYIDNIGAGNASLEIGQPTSAGNLYFDLEAGNAIVFRNNTAEGNAPTFFVINKSGAINVYGDMDIQGNDIVDANTINVLGNNFYMGSINNGNVALRRDDRVLHLLPWGGSSYSFDQVCIGCGSSANFTVNGSASIKSNVGVDGYLALKTANTDWARIEGHGKGTSDDGGLDFKLGDDSNVNYRWYINGEERMKLAGNGNLSLSADTEIFWANNGQIRSSDDNHRIIFDRDHDDLEIREFGEIYLHAGGENGGDADLVVSDSQIDVKGNSMVNCGAFVEANLQTKEELEAGSIDRFEEGDVLCWGIDQLELCSIANDRLVQAIADGKGRPIVIGAEVIKALGPVKRGDILVASEVPGYAMVNNDPVSGSVIAQALENFDGERGIIKAMIRKW